MLLDIGIYERDVDTILKIVGNDFEDAFEMKQKLLENHSSYQNSISYISNFIINGL